MAGIQAVDRGNLTHEFKGQPMGSGIIDILYDG